MTLGTLLGVIYANVPPSSFIGPPSCKPSLTFLTSSTSIIFKNNVSPMPNISSKFFLPLSITSETGKIAE